MGRLGRMGMFLLRMRLFCCFCVRMFCTRSGGRLFRLVRFRLDSRCFCLSTVVVACLGSLVVVGPLPLPVSGGDRGVIRKEGVVVLPLHPTTGLDWCVVNNVCCLVLVGSPDEDLQFENLGV